MRTIRRTFLRDIFAASAFALATTLLPAAEPNRTVSVEEAAALLKKDKAVVVLDVRTPEEFKEGHIPGAVNLDFNGDNFDKELAKFDRSKTYLMHCAAGGRSSQTEDQMAELKFKSVLHLKEGFNGWKKKNQPVEK